MRINGMSYLSIGVACAAVSLMPITQTSAANTINRVSGQPVSMSPGASIAQFRQLNRESAIYKRSDGTIGRVYGKAFSHGQTAAISAARFVNQHLSMWGVPQDQLVAEGPFADGRHTQQIGYLPEFDDYKFTGHYYKQIIDGVPVFRSKLVLLTRNEANNPLVLASSELRTTDGFELDPQLKRLAPNHNRIIQSAEQHFNLGIELDSTERVIYAGVEDAPHDAVLADASTVIVNGFEKHLILTDATTGEVLFTESLIHTLDISGNVSGLGTEGIAADICEEEISKPLPYLFVTGPSGTVVTDINGNYTLPNAGTDPVTVEANLAGQWFEVFDFVGPVESLSQSIDPANAGDFVFNSANTVENTRAETNAYIEANIVRDFVVDANPMYPGIDFQMDVTVNRTDGFCPGNAWYDPGDQSINFCSTGGSSPNTAWSSVVHHEYGHHVVNVGGSGQGQYGEGFGDVMSAIILDDNRLGVGFFGSCGSALRNAVNSLQYPCATDGHACAGLLSGAVWETRNALVDSGISNYTEILNFLAVNSVLVHSGSTITPQITIDWLTLDDDDADIGNGTPHYAEIAAGFGSKNMDAPALNIYSISFPADRPELVNPDGGTTLQVNFTPISGPVDPSTATLMVDTGSGFTPIPMTQNSATEFEVDFPGSDCGSLVSYYIASETATGTVQNSPAGAPFDGTYSTVSAFGDATQAFADTFETDQGWSVSGNASDGQWDRGIPAAGNRGDPGSDYDGSSQCYVTDNVAGNSDVDGGSTILTSPVMDASGDAMIISYARWYDNSVGADPLNDIFVVEVSDDAGANWTNLETVGPAGPEVMGGWVAKQFALNDIPGFTPNNQFRIRFNASDLSDGSVVEAAVDAVELLSYSCIPAQDCPADLSGDGVTDFIDVSAFVGALQSGDLAADLNGDGEIDFIDISAFLASYTAGCP